METSFRARSRKEMERNAEALSLDDLPTSRCCSSRSLSDTLPHPGHPQPLAKVQNSKMTSKGKSDLSYEIKITEFMIQPSVLRLILQGLSHLSKSSEV
jgi:hypothetical protein